MPLRYDKKALKQKIEDAQASKVQNNQLSFVLSSTRFTNETYGEYVRYKENNDIKGSIYNVSFYLRYNNVPIQTPMIVLEMNNSANKFTGMGLIINQFDDMNKYLIYNDHNYNRYTYISPYHICFDESSSDYIEIIEKSDNCGAFKNILDVLTTHCFYGKSHIKRGSSFTKVPVKLFRKEDFMYIKYHILQIFKKKYDTLESMELNDGKKEKQYEVLPYITWV